MLTQVVLVQQILLHGRDVGGHGFRTECHESQCFRNRRVVDRMVRICAPGERAMTSNSFALCLQHSLVLLDIRIETMSADSFCFFFSSMGTGRIFATCAHSRSGGTPQ